MAVLALLRFGGMVEVVELGSRMVNGMTYRFIDLGQTDGAILARAEMDGQTYMALSRDNGVTFVPEGGFKLPNVLMGDVALAYKQRQAPHAS
jgi:hypothetical protein